MDYEQDEKIVIGTLLTMSDMDDPRVQERLVSILKSLSVFLRPDDFSNEFYANLYDLMVGDVRAGLVPEYNSLVGQLRMDGEMPDDAPARLREAFDMASPAPEVMPEAARRLHEAAAIRRAVDNAVWKTTGGENK